LIVADTALLPTDSGPDLQDTEQPQLALSLWKSAITHGNSSLDWSRLKF